MDYDFSNLTQAQQWLLTRQGWVRSPVYGTGPRRKTVDPLIERGLVTERKDRGGTTVAFDVSIAVHRAWCVHCSNVAKG